MSDELNKIIDEINKYQIIEPEKITLELIENNKTQQSRLIFNEDVDFSVKLEKRGYKYTFTDPIYVNHITLRGINSLNSIKISYIDIHDETVTIDTRSTNNAIQFNIKKSIKAFIITPPKNVKIELKKIEIFGYKIDRYISIQSDIKSLEKLRENLQVESKKILDQNANILSKIENEKIALQEAHTELDESIDELTITKENLESEQLEIKEQFSKQQIELEKLMDDLAKNRDIVENLSQKERQVNDSIEQKETTSKALNEQISKEEAELKKLEGQTSLIAYDIQAYVKNANEDIKLYVKLSVIPWVLIAIVTGFIFFGSADLSTVLRVKEDAQIWTIFWSRIPFVAIVATVLFVAYEVSNIFINRIISIHQQKSDFAKIGIIAKDVSDASMEGLALTDKEKFELRTKLKMDMLKSHLSRELGKKYECKINPNIWVKYGDMLTLKKKDKNSAVDSNDENIEIEAS